jgi:hypothetical protein
MKHLLMIAATLLALTSVTNATGPDNCAVVSKTPDGFLNVRKAPTMKSDIIAKIHPGDLVYADAYECSITDACQIDNWTHIASVLRSSGPNKPQALRGWVGTQFLKWRPLRYSNSGPRHDRFGAFTSIR